MIQIMLLPHPPHPDAGASHPHPQFVAAKSLMLIPPELSLHFQYMHHGMSDFHSEDEKCCSSFPAEAVAEGKILYGPNMIGAAALLGIGASAFPSLAAAKIQQLSVYINGKDRTVPAGAI